MPWMECDRMSQREEFVLLARQDGAKVAELCRRFRISRKTGYKWIGRFGRAGRAALGDASRRPRRSPRRTAPEVEQAALAVRTAHPAWGGRKIRARLLALKAPRVPAASTITEILRRHDRLEEQASAQRGPMQRFGRARPNDLWQMDFKGDFGLGDRTRCHPLTVLDDHSRYSIGVRACPDQQYRTVRDELEAMFRIHGLPREILSDNGSPWAVPHDQGAGLTRLTAWLLRLDVRISHGRPYHPQTQGKEERFHRTLKQELLRDQWFDDLAHAQRGFDPWRRMYNHERPHEALGLEVPASRYQPSVRAMPETLPPLEYGPEAERRAVNPVGQVRFQGRRVKASQAFAGECVGLRATACDGVFEILWARFVVGEADLRQAPRGAAASVRFRSLRSLQRTDADPVTDGTL